MNTLGPMDRLLLVRAMPAFGLLPGRLLATLAERLQETHWPAGATMHEPTRPADSASVLVEGRVSTWRDGLFVGSIEAPTGYGLVDMLARCDDGLEVRADTDALVLSARASAFMQIYEEWFPLVRTTLRDIAARLIELQDGLPRTASRLDAAAYAPPMDQPIGLVERLRVLLGVPIFASLDLDTLLPLARRMRVVRVPAGNPLWEAGDPATWGIALLQGTVRCETADGRALDVDVRHPLGFVSSLAAVPRPFRATPVTEIVGLAYDIDTVFHIAETRFELARKVLATLSRALITAQLDKARAEAPGLEPVAAG